MKPHQTYHGCPNWTTAGCACPDLREYPTELEKQLAAVQSENAALLSQLAAAQGLLKNIQDLVHDRIDAARAVGKGEG